MTGARADGPHPARRQASRRQMGRRHDVCGRRPWAPPDLWSSSEWIWTLATLPTNRPSRRGSRFPAGRAGPGAGRKEPPASSADQGRDGAMARDAERSRAGWPATGPRIRRGRLERRPAPHLRGRVRRRPMPRASCPSASPCWARSCRKFGIKGTAGLLAAAHPDRAMTGGARAIPNRVPGPTCASLNARNGQGDHYIVNGQKTWTTLGQHANMIFCLVRTSTRRASSRKASPSC